MKKLKLIEIGSAITKWSKKLPKLYFHNPTEKLRFDDMSSVNKADCVFFKLILMSNDKVDIGDWYFDDFGTHAVFQNYEKPTKKHFKVEKSTRSHFIELDNIPELDIELINLFIEKYNLDDGGVINDELILPEETIEFTKEQKEYIKKLLFDAHEIGYKTTCDMLVKADYNLDTIETYISKNLK